MSIPATPKRRRLFAKGRLQDGEAKEGPPYSPRPPPLSQTILKARDMALVRNSKSIARGGVPDTNLTKLLAGGDAAYLISALAASGASRVLTSTLLMGKGHGGMQRRRQYTGTQSGAADEVY